MLLMLCALIWGTAFVAQSAGSGMGAFSFLAGRSWMAVLVLIPTVKAFDALHHRQGRPDGKPKTAAERKLLLKAGLMCGTLLFWPAQRSSWASRWTPPPQRRAS